MTAPAPDSSTPPYATWADFEVRMKTTLTEPERKQVAAIIADVYAYILTKRPLIESVVEARPTASAIVVAVIFQVGSRMLQVAERSGVRSEQYPEWSVTLTDAAQRGLYLTDDEWAMLPGAVSSTPAAAYSVQLYR